MTHAHLARLDRKVKELAQEKEDLLKSSKSQAATTESVKLQIEALLKVALAFLSCPEYPLSVTVLPPRPRQKSARKSRSLFLLLQIYPMKHPCQVNIPVLAIIPSIFPDLVPSTVGFHN